MEEKKHGSSFDVTMARYDKAEPYELNSVFTGKQLGIISKSLYRDDALIILCNINSQEKDKIRKKFIYVLTSKLKLQQIYVKLIFWT